MTISGYDLAGKQINLNADGLFARIVQHEADHLDGVLIIDRLTPTGRMAVKELIEEFENEFQQRRQTANPRRSAIAAHLSELEELRT